MKDKKMYFLTGGLLLSTAVFSIGGMLQKNFTFPASFQPDTGIERYLPFVTVFDNLHQDTLCFANPFQDNYACQDVWENTQFATPAMDEETAPLASAPDMDITLSDTKTLKLSLLTKAAFLDMLGVKDACTFVNQGLPLYQHMTDSSIALLGTCKEEVYALQDSLPQPATYDFSTVDESYFADAVFIGDSRTVGIESYSGIENATFLCKTSLTIFDYDKPKLEYNGKKTSIREVLRSQQFKKIYLMVGINDCTSSGFEDFFAQYTAVVADIRSLQPDALLFLEGNLSMTQEKSAASPRLNNQNLFKRNAAIQTLANQRNIFYIDINESSLCENGVLIGAYTWDQVHIKAEYYTVWKDFLLKHGIIT